MSDIENKIDELFNLLEESNVFKDYVKIKKQLEEDKDIFYTKQLFIQFFFNI